MNKPGYKQTALGWIPEEWEVKELGELGQFRGGGTPSTENPEYWHGEIPWVSPKDMKSDIIIKTQDYITEQALSESSATEIGLNSILIVTRSGILRSHVPVAINRVRVAINQDIKALSCFIHETNDYVFQYLRCYNQTLLVQSGKVGTTVESLDFSALKSFKIPLPPLLEQRKIVAVLASWDNAIDIQKALIATLKTRHRALMQSLLAGKVRLKGFAGEWREVRLGDVFERVTRKNTEGNKTVVTISAQRGFVLQTDFFNKNIASDITDNYFLVERGEFCYNKSYSNGYPWGATKRLTKFEKAVVTTLYICFGIRDKEQTSATFFEHYFEGGLLENGLMKIAHEGGRAHGLLNVTPTDFFNLKIHLPTIAEQHAIAQILTTSESEIAGHRRQLAALKEQKKGLMQVLLSGKKRVQV